MSRNRTPSFAIASLALALAGCSSDPVQVVKEATTLCDSEQPFAEIVALNVSDPSYAIVSERGDRTTVAVRGRVVYYGDPVRMEIAVDDGTPIRFSVTSERLGTEPGTGINASFCAGELPLAPGFGGKADIAARVDRARQAQESIARMVLIEKQTPGSSVAAEFSNREPFRVIAGATLEIPLSDLFLDLPRPVIHMVPRQANKTLFFSCMTNLPYPLHPLLPEDCQNPLDPGYGRGEGRPAELEFRPPDPDH